MKFDYYSKIQKIYLSFTNRKKNKKKLEKNIRIGKNAVLNNAILQGNNVIGNDILLCLLYNYF